ncbi:hypothetical protein OA2633_13285 [Oceanicaulis alexandrii HTCC2633]|uniref:hypothetical protein n=1 Tax=Oceanicaulis sp. HTCC2633 TaxID=314254 RepID=UPI0000668AFD|nr:hypothetical protein [Oceanicaulis sp. HTCC2633]EAP90680.1 hypothetical protein OA2633_13285 [Oceanicaulis alexandrii HTCC2633] [Oceanicaulis sp. HTCC2633]
MLHTALTALALLYPLSADIQMGGGETANAPALDQLCASQTRRELDPSELPLAQTSHVQIDCDGYVFRNAPRRAEFVFADDRLTHVWILLEPDELDALEADLIQDHGAPSVRTDNFSAFFNARAAVRRDVPEALYYAEEAAPLFEAFFGDQG